jgi:hypothetical protein
MPELENARHELFAVLIAQGKGSEGDCYMKAGYTAKSMAVASAGASRLLKTVKVCTRVQELKAMWAKEAGITTIHVLRWLQAIASFDPRNLLVWNTDSKGNTTIDVKPSHEIDDATALAIRSIKHGPHGLEFTFEARQPAIVKLGEHLGMFTGESAEGGNLAHTDPRSIIYVDAPRGEPVEEWQARVHRERANQKAN